MRYVELPTRSWVPQWVGLLTMFLIMTSVVLVNGTYVGSSVDISGALGTTSEDIMMAYYATSVGVVAANPLVHRIRKAVTSKTLILSDMALQVLLSLVCAQTHSMDLVAVCSFFMGMLKTTLIVEFIILITPLLSPGRVRSEYFSYFFPIVFGGGLISMSLTAWLANSYRWQYTYYFIIILLLLTMAFVFVFFRDARRPHEFPFREINYRSIFLVSTAYMMIVYVLTYGKTLDWFESPRIRLYSVLGILLLLAFFYHIHTTRKPYISLHPLTHLKSILGYAMMLFCMVLNNDTTLVNSYVTGVLGLDNVHSYRLGLWSIAGYGIAGFVSFWWFRWQRWRFRYLVSAAFWLFAAHYAILFSGIQPGGSYEALYLPMVLRGAGMMLLVIAFGVFTAEDLPQQYLVSNTFFLISVRSVMGPVIASCLMANGLYRLQGAGIDRLAAYFTSVDPAASQQSGSLATALAAGKPYTDALLTANQSLYSTLQMQGTLWALKHLFGYLLLASALLGIVTAFIPFHKTVKVDVVKTGEDMA